MKGIKSGEDKAISTTKGVVIILVILIVSLSLLVVTGPINLFRSSSGTLVKADAYTTLSSICCAYDYKTTVSIDVTNFTLGSASNSEMYASLVVINSSGAFVYYGFLGNKNLSPYYSTLNTSSNNFSVNSKYQIHFFGSDSPTHIFLNISYSNSIIYSSGEINQSTSLPQVGSLSAFSQFYSTGNVSSGYNTRIYLNISSFSLGQISNSRIGIQFEITNSSGNYTYDGLLSGNFTTFSNNASTATLVYNSKYFGGGSVYEILLEGNHQTSSISLKLIYCNNVIFISGNVT